VTVLALACTAHEFTAEDAWAVAMAAEAEEAAAQELQRQRDEEAARRLQAAEVRGARDSEDSPAQVLLCRLLATCTPSDENLRPALVVRFASLY
jgi:hypothetical protein